jgi:nucleotide-binding universal stress UspA family protein
MADNGWFAAAGPLVDPSPASSVGTLLARVAGMNAPASPPPEAKRDRHIVLAAIDDTPSLGDVVVQGALATRTIPGAELHLLHVLDDIGKETDPAPASAPLHSAIPRIRESTELLQKASQNAGALTEAPIFVHGVAGKPWREIVQYATDLRANLIVLGWPRPSVRFRLSGSVVDNVLHHACCPVLVARPTDYSKVAPEIEPACVDCVAVRQASAYATFWCERHSHHHARAHTYSQVPSGFAVGSMLIRP